MSTRTTHQLPGAAGVSTTRARHPALVRLIWLSALLVVLIAIVPISIMVGVREVGLDEVFSALAGATETINEAIVAKRIPRTVLAVLVGAALAMSGAVMQTVTRNPIADPGILGVTGGASFAVVVGIAFFGIASAPAFTVFAIVGGMLAAVFVYSVGSLGQGGATPLKLALAGAATSAALASLVSAIMLPRTNELMSFQRWQIGGVGGAEWSSIGWFALALILGTLLCIVTSRSMNALALGDELATGLGVAVRRSRLFAAFGAVVLAGAATAIAGPIGFVGLIIAHIVRLIVGPDIRWVLPFSAVLGAILLTASDVIGRVVLKPEELPVGVVTGIIGAPFFIWIVRRQKVREL